MRTRWPVVGMLTEGTSVIIYAKNGFDENQMLRSRITMQDVQAEMRQSGAATLDEVSSIIVEHNGGITVVTPLTTSSSAVCLPPNAVVLPGSMPALVLVPLKGLLLNTGAAPSVSGVQAVKETTAADAITAVMTKRPANPCDRRRTPPSAPPCRRICACSTWR